MFIWIAGDDSRYPLLPYQSDWFSRYLSCKNFIKVEATKGRLTKNPEHTEAYDKKMTELTEMNFAKKWTACL